MHRAFSPLPAAVQAALTHAADLARFVPFFREEWPRDGSRPSPSLVARARRRWGNGGYAARQSFLERALDLVHEATGPVVECGSGLSTVLCLAQLRTRPLPYVALEHDPRWVRHVRLALRLVGLDPAPLLWAPLADFGDFSWYDLVGLRIPDRIALLLCDGPAGWVPGYRFGALPALAHRLAPGARILVDDIDRTGERATVVRWMQEYGLALEDPDLRLGSTALLRAPW